MVQINFTKTDAIVCISAIYNELLLNLRFLTDQTIQVKQSHYLDLELSQGNVPYPLDEINAYNQSLWIKYTVGKFWIKLSMRLVKDKKYFYSSKEHGYRGSLIQATYQVFARSMP